MVVAKLKICRKRSRAVGARPNALRIYGREWRRALGPKKKKYAAMKYRKTRLKVRPRRSDRNAIIFSSHRLPRSRCVIHSAALAFMQRPARHLAVPGAEREADQTRRRCLVLQDQGVARPDGVVKFRRADMPAPKIDAACNLNGAQCFIHQYRPWQHGKARKVAGKHGVVRRNIERDLHFHCASPIRSSLSAGT